MEYPADLTESFEALSGFLSTAEDIDATLARIATLSVAVIGIGGILGVMYSVPLRRALVIRNELVLDARAVAALLAAKSSEQEAAEYKKWAMSVAEKVAMAAREGGFLGFGIEPSAAAEWGYDLNKALPDASSGIWWTGVFPGTAIVLIVLGLFMDWVGILLLTMPIFVPINCWG